MADHLFRLHFDTITEPLILNESFPDEQLMSVEEINNFFWDDPYLFKYCADQIVRQCVPESEIQNILSFCHE